MVALAPSPQVGKARNREACPRVSVIIPARNAEKTLQECISSVLRQTQRPHEIIVADDGSTDGTPAIITSFKNKIRHFSQPPKGSYSARNKAIAHARGDIIAFIDSDCVAEKDWLFFLIVAFKKRTIALVGGAIRAHKPSSIIQRYCDVHCHPQGFFSISDPPYFAASNLAVRRKWKGKQIFFDERLRSGADVELCARLARLGALMRYEPKAAVSHKYSRSVLSFVSKHFSYGAGSRSLLLLHGLRVRTKTKPPQKIWKEEGILAALLRLIQSASFHAGYFWPFPFIEK
jgi:glycosyltransferase involved in cell wall biosynthesis